MRVRPASAKVRRRLWEEAKGLCAICGQPVDYNDMDLDHDVARCQGGLTTLENLRVTHGPCNRRKGGSERSNGALTPEGFMLTIAIQPELRQELDDYRYANRYPTLAEAVRAVIRAGLAAERARTPKAVRRGE